MAVVDGLIQLALLPGTLGIGLLLRLHHVDLAIGQVPEQQLQIRRV